MKIFIPKNTSLLFLMFVILIIFSGCFKYSKTVSKDIYSIKETENPYLDKSTTINCNDTTFQNYKGLNLYSIDICYTAVTHRPINLLKYKNLSDTTEKFFELKFFNKSWSPLKVSNDTLILWAYDQSADSFKIPINNILEFVKSY